MFCRPRRVCPLLLGNIPGRLRGLARRTIYPTRALYLGTHYRGRLAVLRWSLDIVIFGYHQWTADRCRVHTRKILRRKQIVRIVPKRNIPPSKIGVRLKQADHGGAVTESNCEHQYQACVHSSALAPARA